MSRTPVLLSVFFLIALPSLSPASGVWTENGMDLCTSYNEVDPATVAVGQGETVVAWVDSRGVVAQLYDSFGRSQWGSCGVVICTASGTKQNLSIASDGAGGAIVVWEDYRTTNWDIYAQRVNASGGPQWSMDGVAICAATGHQLFARTISDGAGGAIISWGDARLGVSNYNIWAGRVNGSGTVQWTVPVCSETYSQQVSAIVPDGAGGAIISWQDMRGPNSGDIYAQRVNGSGLEQWLPNGVDICTESHVQQALQMIADGNGGAIIVWEDSRSAVSWDIYAQRVNSSSTRLWTTNGVAVCNASEIQMNPGICSDNAGGAVVAWTDNRVLTEWTVYAQRLGGTGTAMWTANGLPVGSAYSESPSILADGANGAIVSWTDSRTGNNKDICAQRLTSTGIAYWQAGGLPVCTAPGDQEYSRLVSDGSGGCVVVWRDYRTGNYDYFIQRLERNGYWGYPSPSIHAIRDVPGDQGGYVNLAWDASRLDPWPNQLISYYSLWKAIDPTQASLLVAGGATMLSSPDETRGVSGAQEVRTELIENRTYYWELVATQEANYYETYSKKLATDFDSSSVVGEPHYFQVCAHAEDPKATWTSLPDSGYSVDNLGPAAPVGLAGKQSATPEGLSLSWRPNREADLSNYAVYRGLTPDFVPGPPSLISSPADTVLFDSEWRWDSDYYYKVSARDVHGNEGPYAILTPEDVTGIGGVAAPSHDYLEQNHPNPFNPSTTIAFGIRGNGHVSLKIFDATGRLVRVLVDDKIAARRYEEVWDGHDGRGRKVASGVYFYQLTAGNTTLTRKAVLLK